MIRRTFLIVVLVHSLAPLASAQHNQLSVFVSESAGSVPVRSNRGYGLALTRQWTPRLSTGMAVAIEDPVVRECTGGFFDPLVCSETTLRTYPVDLTGRFHFINDTRWKPYVGIGARYVRAPRLSSEASRTLGRDYADHLDPQVVGGLEFLITPSIGVGTEVKVLFCDNKNCEYDSELKVAGGFIWRF